MYRHRYPIRPTFTLRWVAVATVLAATAASSHAADPEVTTYATPKVMFAAKNSNVRAGPGLGHRIVGLLRKGTVARVTGKAGDWYRLQPQGSHQDRFVYSPLLTGTRPASSPAPEPSASVVNKTITYTNARYVGQTRDGKRHGQGVLTFNDGRRYEGDFRNGKYHGRGTWTWEGTGEFAGRQGRYEGDWQNGREHGRGVKLWPDGGRYEGEWRDGERSGQGTFFFANGNIRRGEYRKGQLHGRATFTWAGGDSRLEEWREGKFVRDPHEAQSTCLKAEGWIDEAGFWVNRCNVGIDVIWRDLGWCGSKEGDRYPCSAFVPAGQRVSAILTQKVWHFACQSPGGPGQVLVVERGDGKRRCIVEPTSATIRRKIEKTEFAERGYAQADRRIASALRSINEILEEPDERGPAGRADSEFLSTLNRMLGETEERLRANTRRETSRWCGAGERVVDRQHCVSFDGERYKNGCSALGLEFGWCLSDGGPGSCTGENVPELAKTFSTDITLTEIANGTGCEIRAPGVHCVVGNYFSEGKITREQYRNGRPHKWWAWSCE